MLDHSPVATRAPHDAGALSRVVYRSRATRLFDPSGLPTLIAAAQRRNRAERLTGMVVHVEGRFLQWLEGSPASLGRVLDSIRRDPRHDSIEVLADGKAPLRLFDGWDMELVIAKTRCDRAERTRRALLVDALDRPGAAAERALEGYAAATAVCRCDGGEGEPLGACLADALARSFARRLDRDGCAARRPFACALLDAEPEAGCAMLCAALERFGHDERAAIDFLHHLSGALGDLWQDDLCGEAAIAVQLALMQAAFSRRVEAWRDRAPVSAGRRRILVATLPGERHVLPAILLRQTWALSGWAATAAFPESLDALKSLVAGARPDALCLATSNVFRRDHRVADLAEAVASARSAAGCRPLQVTASGRLCLDGDGMADRIGADGAFAGPNVPRAIAFPAAPERPRAFAQAS